MTLSIKSIGFFPVSAQCDILASLCVPLEHWTTTDRVPHIAEEAAGLQIDIVHVMKSSYWNMTDPCCMVSLRLKLSVRALSLTQQAT